MIIVGIVIAVLTVFYLSLKSSGDGGVVESKSFFLSRVLITHRMLCFPAMPNDLVGI